MHRQACTASDGDQAERPPLPSRTLTWQEDASSNGAFWREGVVDVSTEECEQDLRRNSVARGHLLGKIRSEVGPSGCGVGTPEEVKKRNSDSTMWDDMRRSFAMILGRKTKFVERNTRV